MITFGEFSCDTRMQTPLNKYRAVDYIYTASAVVQQAQCLGPRYVAVQGAGEVNDVSPRAPQQLLLGDIITAICRSICTSMLRLSDILI
jgi:hypothetical protein